MKKVNKPHTLPNLNEEAVSEATNHLSTHVWPPPLDNAAQKYVEAQARHERLPSFVQGFATSAFFYFVSCLSCFFIPSRFFSVLPRVVQQDEGLLYIFGFVLALLWVIAGFLWSHVPRFACGFALGGGAGALLLEAVRLLMLHILPSFE